MCEERGKSATCFGGKTIFLFFCFFFSPLSELKIRLIKSMKSPALNQEQNKTKKKQQTPQKHFKYTLSVSSLSLFLVLLSRFKRRRSIFIREFVLYFESDEKRNKTAFVSIGLLRRNFESTNSIHKKR